MDGRTTSKQSSRTKVGTQQYLPRCPSVSPHLFCFAECPCPRPLRPIIESIHACDCTSIPEEPLFWTHRCTGSPSERTHAGNPSTVIMQQLPHWLFVFKETVQTSPLPQCRISKCHEAREYVAVQCNLLASSKQQTCSFSAKRLESLWILAGHPCSRDSGSC